MAIYHLRLKVHSRSLGRDAKPGGATRRSAIAAAAYRSGQRLYDDSQGKWFSYDKPDVVHTEILAPGTDVPACVRGGAKVGHWSGGDLRLRAA